MSFNDPVADLLTRIRNSIIAKHDRVDMPLSKLRREICEILKQEGLIRDYQVVDGHPAKTLRLQLRYTDAGEPAIRHLSRVSRPGRRVYRKADQIEPVLNGLGVGIFSTSKGLLTADEARQQRVGGEFLCRIW